MMNHSLGVNLVNRVQAAILAGLEEASKRHDELGSAGANQVRQNAFGETSLECDIACEAAVLEALSNAGLSGTAYTEEHGVCKIGSGQVLTFTIDGLDGTSRYREAPGEARYSTMVAVLSGDNPQYDDYLFVATKQHSAKKLYYALPKEGAFVEQNGQKTRLQVAKCDSISAVKKSYIDAYFPDNQKFYAPVLEKVSAQYLKASCIYYEDLAAGQADLVMECTRKGNLELACAYGLVKEAGGVMLLADNSSLGLQHYKSFAQIAAGVDAHLPIVSAASFQLASEVIDLAKN